MADKVRIYMRVTGDSQGVFKGKETVSRADEGEGDAWFEISSFNFPPWNGPGKYNADGKWEFTNGSLVITKILGTLAFARAQAIGESIDKIEIQLVRQDQAGVDQIYMEYTLTDALIAGRTNGWDSANRGAMETLSITFKKIEVTQPGPSDGSLGTTIPRGWNQTTNSAM